MRDLLTITVLILILAFLVGGGFYLDYLDKHDLRDLERFQRFKRVMGGDKHNKLGG